MATWIGPVEAHPATEERINKCIPAPAPQCVCALCALTMAHHDAYAPSVKYFVSNHSWNNARGLGPGRVSVADCLRT